MLSFDMKRRVDAQSRLRSASNYSLMLPLPKQNSFQKSVFYQGYKYWNELPVDIRMTSDYICGLKRKLNGCSELVSLKQGEFISIMMVAKAT